MSKLLHTGERETNISMQASLHTDAVQVNHLKADKQRRKIPSEPKLKKKVAAEIWQCKLTHKLGREVISLRSLMTFTSIVNQ